MYTPYFCLISSYLLGSIPVGLLLGKCFGVDVRRSGSANIGATNVSRLLGKKLGLATLIGDALKAVLPMVVAGRLLAGHPQGELWIMLCGGAAFLGHLYPLYIGFKGGKGVATALGVFLYLDPLAVLIVFGIFVGIVARWRYVSAGSITAAALMPGLLWLLGASPAKIALGLAIALLIWLKHRTNIGRLLRGEEAKWGTPAPNTQ